MVDDRSLPPSPARVRRAWRAGLRPRSRWPWLAAAGGLVAVAIDAWPVATGGWSGPVPGAVEPSAWLGTAAAGLGAVLLAAGLGRVGLGAALRQLGWISAAERRRLHARPAAPSMLARLGLASAAALGLGLALAGVLAGAARSVDASEAGLRALWLGWAVEVVVALAVVAGLVGAAELLIDRHERGWRLRQTPRQVAAEAQTAGGRSR